jgi:endonuclease/exonuclease/phosphatase family metal-dependent hydrolase
MSAQDVLQPLVGASVESLVEELKRPADLAFVPQFRLATYNVHNLFGDRPDVHSSRPDPPTDTEQLRALGEVIRMLDADVIAFQEVQNEKILAQLFRKHVNPALKRADQPRFDAFVCIPSHDPRGINVALATRLAVRGTVSFHDYEFGPVEDRASQFSRDLLGVEVFVTPEYSFLFFVAHLKSKLGAGEGVDKRRLETTEIRTLLERPVFGGRPYIEQDMVLAGDMNDDPSAEAIEILRGGPDAPLVDVIASVEPNYTYPTHTRRKKTRLDFVFASRSLEPRITERRIHNGDDDLELLRQASDHFPASLTIDVP